MNEYVTVFRAKEYPHHISCGFTIAIFFEIIILAILVTLLISDIKSSGIHFLGKGDVKCRINLIILVLSIIMCILIITTVISAIEDRESGVKLYETYANGDCDYIEGYISDYFAISSDSSRHDGPEHFTVNGVMFAFYRTDSDYYYSKCKNDGGVLRDGLYVKLWYTNVDIGGEYPNSYIMQVDCRISQA